MYVFDRKLPRQEDLHAIAIRREVVHVEAAATSPDHTMRLTCVEYHGRSAGQRNALPRRGEMQVEPLVVAQEQVAECRAAVLHGVMVIRGAAASH